ncbi:hypothetical protein YC2023_107874 [Brassica napus]
MSLSLDLLEEKRETARLRNWSYQQEVAKTYNKKVRTRTFQQSDWVLRRTEKTTVKLTPEWEGPYKIIEVRGAGAYRLQDAKGESRKVTRSHYSKKNRFDKKQQTSRRVDRLRLGTPQQTSNHLKGTLESDDPILQNKVDTDDILLPDPSVLFFLPAIPS